ncbi:MAG: DNA polymerase III subunit gamma/tau [Prevotella sp.]|nr:DNA polymerase III subunit gamma/tau [Bacteroides sp.]MCM1367102.1 DNA polymerase III subunit gamma/tau [Prevotella sp.]MCM1437367.1 DNA polymerase III subunit gamma/tau [Prevotella sp.]
MEDNQRYIVSARKYRPDSFSSVVGQDALTQTLKNAVSSGRLAQAYLFCGPRGVGKTSCARILAKRINCLNPTPDGEACGECDSCRAIESGSSFNIVELDAASNNSVDDIRNLTEQVTVPPQSGNYRVFIIDEVHMLSSAAFNAFLKTLEEPPSYVVFILATTEKHKVIPTILSRCQIYDFRRITIEDMVRHLSSIAARENITADPAALAVIAQKADGAMRDALSIFDQVSASCNGNVTYEKTIASLNVLDYGYYFRLTEAFNNHNVPQALLIYKEIRDAGFDSLFFINGLASHVRDMMVASDPSTVNLLEVGQEIGKRYTTLAQSMPLQWYYSAIRLLNDADLKYRTSGNKQLLVELTLIRLCGFGNEPSPSLAQSRPANTSASPTPNPQGNGSMTNSVSTSQMSSRPHPSVPPTHQPYSQQHSRFTAPQRPVASPRSGTSQYAPRAASAPRTIRINNIEDNNSSSASDQKSAKPPAQGSSNADVSSEDFMNAWNLFIEKHPALPLLTTAMRSNPPMKISSLEYAIPVGSMAQAGTFENDLPTLNEFLRNTLHNSSVTVNCREVTQQAKPKRLLPAEQLKALCAENKMFRDLFLEMDAELI